MSVWTQDSGGLSGGPLGMRKESGRGKDENPRGGARMKIRGQGEDKNPRGVVKKRVN